MATLRHGDSVDGFSRRGGSDKQARSSDGGTGHANVLPGYGELILWSPNPVFKHAPRCVHDDRTILSGKTVSAIQTSDAVKNVKKGELFSGSRCRGRWR